MAFVGVIAPGISRGIFKVDIPPIFKVDITPIFYYIGCSETHLYPKI